MNLKLAFLTVFIFWGGIALGIKQNFPDNYGWWDFMLWVNDYFEGKFQMNSVNSDKLLIVHCSLSIKLR